MVLKYFGYNISPDGLNNWLKSQVDGYIRNGLLNWLAVSRYTKLNPNASGEALEYSRVPGSNTSDLLAELAEGRPAILEEPGHFVVAKSQTLTSFGINDPAYADRPTLDSYFNTFNSIGRYTPSHTDLSYILLVTNPNTNIAVFDTNGNKIEGYSYTLNPLRDDGGTAVSGEVLNAFSFPKPPEGEYRIELTGNGQYSLETYLYDQSGEVNKSTFDGLIAPSQTDTFTVGVVRDGGNSQTNENLSLDSLLNDLDNSFNFSLINKPQIYNLLRGHLILARGMGERGKTGAVKGLLTAFYYALRAFAPKFITQDASNILQTETLELLNNL